MSSTPIKNAYRIGDFEDMQIAVADFFSGWAFLENQLAILLAVLVSGDEENRMGFALYFSPSALEARLKLVDAAFAIKIEPIAERSDLAAAWNTMMNTLNRLKATRNTIAHGSIEVILVRSKRYIRHVAPLLDISRHEAVPETQVPGLSVTDIRQSVAATGIAADRVQAFRRLFLASGRGDGEAFQQIFARLKGDRQTSAPQQDAPTKSKPRARRRPSRK
jgi:hypothetical protein